MWALGSSSVKSVSSQSNDYNANYPAESIGLMYERVLMRDSLLGIRTGIIESERKGSFMKDSVHPQTHSRFSIDIPVLLTINQEINSSWGSIYPTVAIGPDIIFPIEEKIRLYESGYKGYSLAGPHCLYGKREPELLPKKSVVFYGLLRI